MQYQFKHILGNLVVDQSGKQVSKSTKTQELPTNKIYTVMHHFKDQKNYKKFYEKNLELTKQGIKDSVNQSMLIIQTISNMTELDKATNLLSKRLREWYSLYFPEFVHSMNSHQKLAELIVEHSKKELAAQNKLNSQMGADLTKKDIEEMKLLAQQILALFELYQKHETYLHEIMQDYCPNILALAGVSIGAKLVELAKGLKHFALLPASTIQLLGAEKALFRHIKTGARSPKHGVIIHHPIVQGAPRNIRGKIARALADKLVLCARIDYFKGEFKANEYKKELEERFA